MYFNKMAPTVYFLTAYPFIILIPCYLNRTHCMSLILNNSALNDDIYFINTLFAWKYVQTQEFFS